MKCVKCIVQSVPLLSEHPGTDLWPLFAKTRDISDYFNTTNY